MTGVPPQPGARLGERYELTSLIARGGMGEVWRARDGLLGREVAVKLLRGEYVDDAAFAERFRNESRTVAQLNHPGIAAIYDYGEDAGLAWIVMELVDGEPLSARLAREGALPAEQAVPLLQQAAAALQAAHVAGVVHRDVKPANLLITPDGTIKITDFGIARAGDSVPMTRTGEVMGTAQYLSPEQAVGEPATPRSDVYALGVVAYEALAGVRPFDKDTMVATAMAQVNDAPPPLPEHVPGPVADVVLRALEKDPAARPADAAAFGAALGAALSGVPQGGLPSTQPVPVAGAAAAGAAMAGGTQVMGTVPPSGPVGVPPSTTLPAGGGGHRGRNVALAVLAVLVVAALAAFAVSQLGGSDEPLTPGTTPTTSQPTTSRPSASTTTSESSTTTSETESPSETPSETPTSETSTTTTSSTTSSSSTSTTTTTSSTTTSTTTDTGAGATQTQAGDPATDSAPSPSGGNG